MQKSTFDIGILDGYTWWAELQERRIMIHRGPDPSQATATGKDEQVIEWPIEVLRNLLSWAVQDDAVTAYFGGPMAHQIRQHSKELGMTPEMFVWHAVKVFVEVGEGS